MLFILAGYPAAGKTTTLALAAAHRIELFGPDLQQEFSQTLGNLKDIDERAGTSEKIKTGTWLTLIDCADFEAIAPKPRELTFHLDLLLLLILKLRPKRLADFNSHAVVTAFDQFFDEPLVRYYSEIAVNTLFPDFERVREHWIQRYRDKPLEQNQVISIKNELILNVPKASDLYRSIVQQWQITAARYAHFNKVSRPKIAAAY